MPQIPNATPLTLNFKPFIIAPEAPKPEPSTFRGFGIRANPYSPKPQETPVDEMPSKEDIDASLGMPGFQAFQIVPLQYPVEFRVQELGFSGNGVRVPAAKNVYNSAAFL